LVRLYSYLIIHRNGIAIGKMSIERRLAYPHRMRDLARRHCLQTVAQKQALRLVEDLLPPIGKPSQMARPTMTCACARAIVMPPRLKLERSAVKP
jgi:hypothetical protein